MPGWFVLALVALVAWSVQRVVSKRVLAELSTAQFYFLTAAVSLPMYVPVLVVDAPPLSAFPPALGLSSLMALTFGVTTESLRRGPVGRVSPITGLSPALTAILALTLLDEQVGALGLVGIAVATGAVVLLASKPDREDGSESWVWLAILSFALQGVGAFIAKVVVTPSGPAALLVTSAAVQLGVGATWLRRSGQAFPHLGSRLMRWTVVVLVLAALATIGYLFALSLGPATIIVPLVATSPALGGLVGALVLNERLAPLHLVGITLGMLGAVLLALEV